MFEITVAGKVYPFHFGMGFMREINKKVGTTIDGLPDVKKNMGLQYYVAGILDGDIEALVEVLDTANKGQKPRITRDLLDSYIDDPETDIEKLFDDVLDFLSNANATKKITQMLKAEVEKRNAEN